MLEKPRNSPSLGFCHFPETFMRRLCVAGLCLAWSAHSAQAQWGGIKGRILLQGDVPAQKVLVKPPIPKLPAGAVAIMDESLVVDAKSKGIANIAIWSAKMPAAIHPELINPAAPAVTVNLTGGKFAPHISVMRTDQTLSFVNLDATDYNVRGTPLKNQGFNTLVRARAVMPPMNFKLAERLPVMIGDDIHNWMRAYVIVVDHPYATVTDRDGNFEIKNLPAGEHEFKVWHEIPGYIVKNAGNPRRGLVIDVKDGHTMVIADIKVPVAVFNGKK